MQLPDPRNEAQVRSTWTQTFRCFFFFIFSLSVTLVVSWALEYNEQSSDRDDAKSSGSRVSLHVHPHEDSQIDYCNSSQESRWRSAS